MLARRASVARLLLRTGVHPHKKCATVSAISPIALNLDTRRYFAPTIDFKLSDIGEGIAEVEILKWHVEPGDEISEFDLLCEVQSDKATVEITSRYAGKVKKLMYKEKEMAATGSTLVEIETENGEEAEAGPSAQELKPESALAAEEQAVTNIVNSNGRALATPAVRHIARQNSIDLSRVPATGKQGRVLKEDILKFLENGGQTADATANTASLAQGTAPQVYAPAARAPVPAGPQAATLADEEVPLTGYGKVMVKTMTAANSVPHFGYDDEIVMDRVMELRRLLKPLADERGVKLTSMPIMMKAASMALRQFPQLNAHFDAAREVTIRRGAHNIGVAVDSPGGLIVPNVKHCEQKSIFEIAVELNRIQADASRNVVSPADLKDGTFTLSNIGAIGGTYMSAVLVVPEVLIGATGKIQRLPRFKSADSNEVIAQQIMQISWAADHRVLDGATVARFSNLWKAYLEKPELLLLDSR